MSTSVGSIWVDSTLGPLPTMNNRHRVKVRSDRKMVTLQGERVRHEGEPVDLFGLATTQAGNVQAVQLEDGRELLIATTDLEVVT